MTSLQKDLIRLKWARLRLLVEVRKALRPLLRSVPMWIVWILFCAVSVYAACVCVMAALMELKK
jgi:hypothetical protein